MIMYILILILVLLLLSKRNSIESFQNSLLSIDKAKQMIKDGEIDVIVDVRTKMEWKRGHHPKAIHIPFGSLQNHDFDNYKDKTFLLYCRTGTRARMAMEEIKDKVKRVYYINEGYKKLLEDN